MNETHEITELLQAWRRGESHALSKLYPLVDDELRKLAHKKMARERAGHILQTTALVNEALMRLIGRKPIDWQNRNHFYAFVAKRMRQVLVDYARARSAAKRGSWAKQVDVDDAVILSPEKSEELIMLDQALTKLAEIDEFKVQIIEHRYFGGFTVTEVAEMLNKSPSTVEREWHFARSWLKREMT